MSSTSSPCSIYDESEHFAWDNGPADFGRPVAHTGPSGELIMGVDPSSSPAFNADSGTLNEWINPPFDWQADTVPAFNAGFAAPSTPSVHNPSLEGSYEWDQISHYSPPSSVTFDGSGWSTSTVDPWSSSSDSTMYGIGVGVGIPVPQLGDPDVGVGIPYPMLGDPDVGVGIPLPQSERPNPSFGGVPMDDNYGPGGIPGWLLAAGKHKT